jgi:hypothetical protein
LNENLRESINKIVSSINAIGKVLLD